MIEITHVLSDIVWKSTQIFFVLSFIIFVIFFIIKKILFYTNHTLNTKNIIYNNFHNVQPNTANKLDLLAYANSIGLRLLKSANSHESIALKESIHQTKLYTCIYKYYSKSHFSLEYLYYLNTIVLLQNEDARLLYHDILNKEHHNIVEFNILALHGLSLITSVPNDVLTLHHFLEKSYKNYWISQKLATYFFIISLKKLNNLEIVQVLEGAPENSYITYGLIYALRAIPPSKEMKEKLLQLQERNTQNDVLLITILRTFYAWKTYVPELILSNYTHENELMRIVCSKIGLDLIGKNLTHKLLIYLVDDSQYVRNNFMDALQRHQYTKEKIISELNKYYPNYYNNKPLMKWLKHYRLRSTHA